jgi:hypothetical protein
MSLSVFLSPCFYCAHDTIGSSRYISLSSDKHSLKHVDK